MTQNQKPTQATDKSNQKQQGNSMPKEVPAPDTAKPAQQPAPQAAKDDKAQSGDKSADAGKKTESNGSGSKDNTKA